MSDTSDDDTVEFLGAVAPTPPPLAPPPAAKAEKKRPAKPKLKTGGAGKQPVKPTATKDAKGKKEPKKVPSAGSSKKTAPASGATKPAKSKASAKARAKDKEKDTPPATTKKAESKAPAKAQDKPKKKKKAPVVVTAPPPVAQKRPSGMMSILDLCNDDRDDDETEDDEPSQHPHRPPPAVPHYGGPHVGGLYDDGMSSVDEDDATSVVDSESGSIKTPPKKKAKKAAPAKAPRARVPDGGTGDDADDDSDEGADEGWSDHNRWYCNICKDGGELLCCDRCPRAFHMACLGMKDKAIPDTEWFCKMCAECLDRRRAKKEAREKARLLREAEKLERDATKRKMKQMKEDIIAQKNSEAIEHKAKRVLEMQDRILSRKKIKYKDKEEEKLGKLAEDLAQTVRAAKERLEKLEKEDAALKKKEEAFNKKKKSGPDEVAPEDEKVLFKSDKPTPSPCAFGEIPSEHVADLLSIWDCLNSFASIIELAPITLEQLAEALVHNERSALVTEIHMCLLNLILEDREEDDYVSDDEASMDETERFRFEIQHAPVTIGVPTANLLNSTSWPAVLCNLVLSVPRYSASVTPALQSALTALKLNEYPTLELSQKLTLIHFLIGRVYATERFRQMLGKHVSESVNASKEFSRAALLDRRTAAEEEKKLREKQRLELGELADQGKGSVKTWLKTDKKNANGVSDTASVEGDDIDKKGDANGNTSGVATASSSDSELDDLSEEALTKNEEDLEKLLADSFISRHEYLSRKKLLDLQREKLRKRAEEQLKKQRLLEQQERRRTAAKKGIQEGLVSKDPTLLKAAIEKAKECDLPDRIIVSATHVLEILEAEAVREEEAEARKMKFNKRMRELYVRTEPLGRDKTGLRYWIFRGDKQHLYIEKSSGFDLKRHYDGVAADGVVARGSWSYYSSQAEVKALIESLDERHVAEAQLRLALKENFDTITDDMPTAKPGLLLADMSNDNDAKKRTKGRPANGNAQDDGAVDFLGWRNNKKAWKKKHHLDSDMDALREELLEAYSWLSKRLTEVTSAWTDAAKADWVKMVKSMSSVADAVKPVLALEKEVMAFQLRVQSLMPANGQNERNGKPSNGELGNAASSKDPEKSEEEDDDDDDEIEEIEAGAEDGAVLWPSAKSRDRWITEVKNARTLATLSAAFGSFVLRLDAFGLSEFATEDAVTTRRAKTEKEKQSRKERAVKKKQKMEEEEAEAEVEHRQSIDDWEEDCYICTEGGELLCCDGCPRVFHYPCVGLRRVPRGKTFCHHCDPTVKPVYPVVTGRKLVRAKAEPEVIAESVDGSVEGGSDAESDVELAVDTGSLNAATKHEDQWDVECGVCRLGGELLCCDGCPRAFHTKCIDLETVPEDEWFCDECNLQTCGLCKKNKIRLDSHVICGSEDGTRGCELVFHLKCAKLSAVPEDDWYCKKCRKTLPK